MELSEYIPREELERRWQRVRKFMDCDALVILQNVDQYYLAGTMQTGVLWFPRQGEPLLAVRKSYERAKTESAAREQFVQSDQPLYRSDGPAAARGSYLRGIHPPFSEQRQTAGRSGTTRARQRDAALSLEHHARHRVMFGVAEGDQRGTDAAFGGELLCRS